MKVLIATFAALAIAASPAFAAPKAHTTTKTITTKGADEKATTTVTTKVTPVAAKGATHAKAKMHRKHHVAKATTKKAAPMKKTTAMAKKPATTTVKK